MSYISEFRSSVAARCTPAAAVGIAGLLAAAGLLAGCGQKGPLTLTKATPSAPPASAASAP